MRAFKAAHENVFSFIIDEHALKQADPHSIRWPHLRTTTGEDASSDRRPHEDYYEDDEVSYDHEHVTFKRLLTIRDDLSISLVLDNRMAALHGEGAAAQFLHHHHSALELLLWQRPTPGVTPWRWDRKANLAYRVGLKLTSETKDAPFHEKSFVLTNAVLALFDALNTFAAWHKYQNRTINQTKTFNPL